jgi:TolA-binding protein
MSVLDFFEITDSTTREELIDRINDQEEEINKLESKIEDQEQQIYDLRLVPEQKDRLREAADLMAELGRIHNTPGSKRTWIEGR